MSNENTTGIGPIYFPKSERLPTMQDDENEEDMSPNTKARKKRFRETGHDPMLKLRMIEAIHGKLL